MPCCMHSSLLRTVVAALQNFYSCMTKHWGPCVHSRQHWWLQHCRLCTKNSSLAKFSLIYITDSANLTSCFATDATLAYSNEPLLTTPWPCYHTIPRQRARPRQSATQGGGRGEANVAPGTRHQARQQSSAGNTPEAAPQTLPKASSRLAPTLNATCSSAVACCTPQSNALSSQHCTFQGAAPAYAYGTSDAANSRCALWLLCRSGCPAPISSSSRGSGPGCCRPR
ncbi:hypothetical protein COO60DRAFT_16960 [Scenedesmus sp. NREL 46B-D3]|nr:hypothetical protein COO60DRAFT_16960 [Scenedesmus sp. NREL 46B-D3]